MFKLFLVGLGGFLGSILRYVTSGFILRILEKPYFPYGTLVVNILGCFLIGFLSGLSESKQLFNPETRTFIFIGFLGGFTTFSTFGYEVFNFARDGQLLSSLSNLVLHMVLGIGGVWFGYSMSKLI
ncbi:fluoride efflux transporter CrcB [candidate division KSB1 bacterium]|nr:fluoride efflux transporter CrcB [candidate division KSB1 bacterium]MBL7093153.1 fluoride efflux transporter CrcB [candidate division KSB1 bacterium]